MRGSRVKKLRKETGELHPGRKGGGMDRAVAHTNVGFPRMVSRRFGGFQSQHLNPRRWRKHVTEQSGNGSG